MKTKTRLALSAQTFPVGPHRLQQLKGAAHIALDKGPRPLNRAVHMALGRQMQHQVRIGLLHRRCCSRCIGEVHLEELVTCLGLGQRLDAGEVAGIATFIEIEHQRLAFAQQPAHHRPADKACPTGHQDAVAAGQER